MKNTFYFNICIFFIVVNLSNSSCVSSHIFEDAQTIGKGGRSVEGTLARSVYNPVGKHQDYFTNFFRTRDIGTGRFSYIYGVGDYTDVSIGIDFPVGLNAKFKHQFNKLGNLHHIHGVKADLFIPLAYFFVDDREIPQLALSPTYLYTYRHDDLLSVSTNVSLLSIKTNLRYTAIPGISAGIHVGDQIRFTAGVSYFNNFGAFGTGNLQYFSVEVGIKYDL